MRSGSLALPAGVALAAELLDLSPPIEAERVQQAFRKAALHAHPDHGVTEAQFRALMKARDMLLNHAEHEELSVRAEKPRREQPRGDPNHGPCRHCGEWTLDVHFDVPPPHVAEIRCSTCGRHHQWVAKQGPGAGDSGMWRRSKKGNLWRKRSRVVVTVFLTDDGYKWVRDGEFSSETWLSEDEACADAEESWP